MDTTTRPHKRVQVSFPDDGRTHQSFKDECDINLTMKRWAGGGQLPKENPANPTYGDFTSVPSYMEAREMIRQAGEDFRKLPSAVRAYCRNDPATFLNAIADPEQLQQLKNLGLVDKQLPLPEPPKAPVAPVETPPPTPIVGGEDPPK